MQAQEAGDYGVALAVRKPGEEVYVLGPDGDRRERPVGDDQRQQTANACGNGCYGAFVPLREICDCESSTARGSRSRSPRARVRPLETCRTRDAQRSVRCAASTTSNGSRRARATSVVADFTLERPNRLEYRIKGGASGIVIGNRRWDRTGSEPWVPSPQSVTPQPEPIWAGHITNAFLLETTPTSYVVAFMKPLGPTWFTVRFDRRTLLPRDLRMTTAAHFMRHRYMRFNAPPRIKAPTDVQ